MPYLNYNTIFELDEKIKGKTIKNISLVDNEKGENLLIDFTDGTSCNFLYDWIYEWEILG